MNIIDGQATCFLCKDKFDSTQYYQFHIAMCRDKKRVYTPMNPLIKKTIVEAAEAFMRDSLPGFLIGYGEI